MCFCFECRCFARPENTIKFITLLVVSFASPAKTWMYLESDGIALSQLYIRNTPWESLEWVHPQKHRLHGSTKSSAHKRKLKSWEYQCAHKQGCLWECASLCDCVRLKKFSMWRTQTTHFASRFFLFYNF